MALKIFEIDICNHLEPFISDLNYAGYRILVRQDRRLVGWIHISNHVDNNCISVQVIKDTIKNQIGAQLMYKSLFNYQHAGKQSSTPFIAISIIVCTRNRTNQLANCLKTLLAMEYKPFEILVVDNAPSNDETRHLVESMPVRYIREDKLGLDWARNRGIMEAHHELIAFTDDDALADRYWLTMINEVFSNPQVMAATGYVAPAELETQSQILFEDHYGGMGHGFRTRFLRLDNLTSLQLLWASNFGVGANMAFRKSLFQDIGLFDTNLDVGTPSQGGGDIEMFHRIVNNKYLLVYEPSMLVWHVHRRTDEALRKQIYNNGRGFGCYLITCYVNRTIKRILIIKFFIFNWFLRWNLKNLIRRSKIPRSLTFIELLGMISSPGAYKKSQELNKKIKHYKN